MKSLKQSVQSILNIDFGAILFIVGITFVIVYIFKAIGGQSSLIIDNSILVISSIILIILGIIIIFFNQDKREYKVCPISNEPELKSSIEKGLIRLMRTWSGG